MNADSHCPPKSGGQRDLEAYPVSGGSVGRQPSESPFLETPGHFAPPILTEEGASQVSPLVGHLRQLIHGRGPISFRDFMDAALYHPQFGYYSSFRNPVGLDGDFYTSADLDPVFGRLLARRFEAMAAELELSPASFTIVELGAGPGLLARDILRSQGFPYRILERSAAMRGRQRETLQDFDVEWIDELPKDLTGCIFSNEFFDALAVRRFVRRGGALREIYVGCRDAEFVEVESEPCPAFDAPVQEGCIADISVDAREWVGRIAESLQNGFHLAIDYGYLEREFYARPAGTLMCYWHHQATEDPYQRIGEQDITAHVNFSDLIEAGQERSLVMREFSSQMDFLVRLGILEEMESLAVSGTAEAIERLQAMKKLILPGSMGERFKVLVQRKGGPPTPSIMNFHPTGRR
jgi:SAM-dependent MidA family methyltransferase